MRVWGYADPRHLNRMHLLGEHREIHVLCKLGNGPGPEWDRFWWNTRTMSCLMLRHELLRVEMNRRWLGHHTRDRHPTNVRYQLMLPEHKTFLVTYIARVRRLGDAPEAQERVWFRKQMKKLRFPPCQLEGGADTPWERDNMDFRYYLELGDNWKRRKHHYKPGKWKSGRRM